MLGIDRICKHNIRIGIQQCYFCEIEINISNLEKRLTNEKEYIRGGMDAHQERIKVLEDIFKQVLSRLNTIENFYKIPHKCPVCDGKGIVWG